MNGCLRKHIIFSYWIMIFSFIFQETKVVQLILLPQIILGNILKS